MVVRLYGHYLKCAGWLTGAEHPIVNRGRGEPDLPTSLDFPGSVEDFAGARPRGAAPFKNQMSVDDHVFDPYRILVRFLERRAVHDGLWIENRNIRPLTRWQ